MLWLVFQNYQVDSGTLHLYKSKQLREMRLGNNLAQFLNTWQEHVASMDPPPSKTELLLFFTEQVRRFRPLRETWNYMDQGMLPEVTGTPTYEDYMRLC